jgi:MscS family membrane protein
MKATPRTDDALGALPSRRTAKPFLIFLFVCFAMFQTVWDSVNAGQPIHPLAPPDTSSPRATLKTFLDTVNDAVHVYKAGRRDEARALAYRAARCLNLEKEPPALRDMMALYVTLYLKETLDRIEIPPDDEIPDAKAIRTEKISSWTIPYTEITIALVKDGSSVQRFLFTSDTVRNAEQYYNEVKHLPYRPQSGGGALLEHFRASGSLIVSKAFIDRLPDWARTEIYGQDVWQWIGLILFFCAAAAIIWFLYKCGSGVLASLDTKFGSNLAHNVGGLILPVTLILFSQIGLWFIVYGLRLLNADAYLPIAFVFLFISYAGRIWLIAAILNRIAAVFVSLGGIVRGGVDDQLVHLGFKVLTVIIIGVMIISLGARLGLPTYSLITGVGIGGIAVALAGREALSNIIGTIMIILDRPFKLGDYIVLSEGERGEVAEVGLRSTRIRTRDDILISIPNSVIANAKMINESAPIPMSRIRIKVGVAYGSDLKTVEQILIRIAEQNETVLPDPAPRVRFRRFGDSSLELELLCWIDPPELKGRIVHELSWAIHEEFQNQGIEIPFPQRDVHIRTTE